MVGCVLAIKRALLFCCIFVLASCAIHAQPVFEYLGIEKGLSNNSVTAIYKDKSGFMWFGTFDGLNRYNGYSFKVFRNQFNDPASLPHNYIYAISEDNDNNLWIGTGQGVSTYNNLSGALLPAFFIPYGNTTPEKITAPISNITADSSGNIFIGTNGRGLMVRLKGSGKTMQVPYSKGPVTFADYAVQVIKADKLHRVWVFIHDEGLCLYDAAAGKLKLVNNLVKTANCIEADDSGNLWIGTENGLVQYHINTNTLVKWYKEGPAGLSTERVMSLCFDRQKKLWIGTDGGAINILNPQTGKIDYIASGNGRHSVTSETVPAIFEDDNGRKWIGTIRGGINIIDPYKHRFETVQNNPSDANSLINNFVFSFFEDASQQLWIGTDGGGLSIWNRKENKFTNFIHNPSNPHSLSNNFITNIKSDYLRNTWIATYGGGINRYNSANRGFDHYTCMDAVNKVENKNVLLLYEDKAHDLWAATFNQGRLYRLNRQGNRFEVFDQALTDIMSVTEDATGQLWAGTASALIKIDRKSKQHTYYAIGKPVRAIYEDGKGRLWLGTEGGGLLLFNKKDGSFLRYTTENGLCNNAVLNILEDNNHLLWLATFNGMASFDPGTKLFKNYYQDDGLQSNQFSYNAAFRLQSGELAFGGIKGFNIFSPDSIRPVNNWPPVMLTALRINNVPIGQDNSFISKTGNGKIETLTIPYSKAVLSFEFAALEYTAPNKIFYAYYLQGWDKDWNYSGNIRTASYTHLNEGTYTLRIKATNAEGIWNSKEISIEVIILPPWYRAWWAWCVYLLAFSAAVYFFLLYKNRQEKLRYEVKLAHIEAQKEKELSENKAAFFTNISHEFRAPLSLIINPVKDILHKREHSEENDELNIIYRNARRLLRLVDQLLLFKKTDNELGNLNRTVLNLYTLCRDVYLSFVQQAKAKKISYELVCENKAVEIFADQEKIEIALFNILSNAFKNTPENGRITFSLTELENTVEVMIQDTGKGIPAEAGGKIFDRFYQVRENKMPTDGFGIGLYLAKQFIAAHDGTISYKTVEGEGTAFTIVLKKAERKLNGAAVSLETQRPPALPPEFPEAETEEAVQIMDKQENKLNELVSDLPSLLIIDDDDELRRYINGIFNPSFKVYDASNGSDGIKLAHEHLPDLIICDIVMDGVGGIELCKTLKMDSTVSHIPIILLTGNASEEVELTGIESGADDYMKKPFDKDMLVARVGNILKNRNTLQKYFYNEITLQSNNLKISKEYKDFLENCLKIVEAHLHDKSFAIKTLAAEIGMSHSNLYKKVKSVSGQSVTGFIRFIRLRKAAEMFINTENNINETAYQVGFNDIKYFREQFNKLFGMNPSEYIKKYRKPFNKAHHLNDITPE